MKTLLTSQCVISVEQGKNNQTLKNIPGAGRKRTSGTGPAETL